MGFRLRLACATLRSWQRRERWWVMSDHRVTVFDEHDNVVGFGVYQGSADMLKSAYFATAEERDRTWRTPE